MAENGKKTGHFLLRRGPGRILFACVLLGLFLAGYAATSSRVFVRTCAAQSTTDAEPYFGDYGSSDVPGQVRDAFLGLASLVPVANAPLGCPCLISPVGLPILPQFCVYPSQTEDTTSDLLGSFKDTLIDAIRATEVFIGDWLVDGFVALVLTRINQAEMNLIDWWDTFWFYNMRPAMQDMARQVGVNYADQVRAMQVSGDGQQGGDAQKERLGLEIDGASALAPSENVAVAATLAGGQQRASAMGAAMQKALQDQASATGANMAGTPGAAGFRASERERQRIYEEMFCDPDSNNGGNTCGAAPGFPNIDTQVTKQIYAKLTIDLIGSSAKPSATASAAPGTSGPLDGIVKTAYAAAGGTTLPLEGAAPIPVEAVTALINNMVGTSSMDPIPLPALGSSAGQEKFLSRRSYLARYAAVRATPQYVVGQRMPGSQLNEWVRPLRESAGVPPSQISDNPSYREIMHAMTIDRFNTGKFAVGMMNDETVIEREKLIMGGMTLMMLREYFQMLEREALTLSVQVALLADQAESPNARKDAPMK